MKFSEKYELLESLTTGVIETFAANDKIRGERVLVHIVDCEPQKPEQTAAEWALASFRRLAPEPPGSILETGKYSGTKYAYVVTKPADDAALKSWVRQYELQAQETKETRVHALKTEVTAAPPAVTPILPELPQEPNQSPGQLTQLLRDFDSLTKSKKPADAAPEIPPPPRAPSTNLPGESGLHTAVPWDPAIARHSAPKDPTPPPATPPKPVSLEQPPRVAPENSKAGEFTRFFQGPFRGDALSEMPVLSSQPIEPPKQTPGEFTALFGQVSQPTANKPETGNNTPGPSFTAIFRDMEAPKPSVNPPRPVPDAVIPPPVQPLTPVAPANMTPIPDPVFVAPPPLVNPAPRPTTIPPLPSVAIEKPAPARPSVLPGDGATGAFMQPKANEPAPVSAAAPSGPSPYTQIISRSKLAEAEAAGAQSPAISAGAAKPAAPSLPKIPAVAPPPVPKMPPPPPMPKIAAPKAPKVPKLDVPAPPPVSSMPLIITLAVLFLLAVLVVVYFVLKH